MKENNIDFIIGVLVFIIFVGSITVLFIFDSMQRLELNDLCDSLGWEGMQSYYTLFFKSYSFTCYKHINSSTNLGIEKVISGKVLIED